MSYYKCSKCAGLKWVENKSKIVLVVCYACQVKMEKCGDDDINVKGVRKDEV